MGDNKLPCYDCVERDREINTLKRNLEYESKRHAEQAESLMLHLKRLELQNQAILACETAKMALSTNIRMPMPPGFIEGIEHPDCTCADGDCELHGVDQDMEYRKQKRIEGDHDQD